MAQLFLCLIASGDRLGDSNRDLTSQNQTQATYDSLYSAPSCLELGPSCHTGDSLIAGVGSFETNFPNTIDNCTDNSQAIYQRDEYINRILVRSKDGGTMTAGNLLQIHATVSLADDVSARSKPDAKETAHIYFAAESIGENFIAL